MKGLWPNENMKGYKRYSTAVVCMSIGRPFGLHVVLIAASASMCHVCHVGGYSEDMHQLELHTYQEVEGKRECEGGGSPCWCIISVHGTRSKNKHTEMCLYTQEVKHFFKKKKSKHYMEDQGGKVKPPSSHSGMCRGALRCDHHTSTGSGFLFLIYSHITEMALEGF